jgi:hypothetical protein
MTQRYAETESSLDAEDDGDEQEYGRNLESLKDLDLGFTLSPIKTTLNLQPMGMPADSNTGDTVMVEKNQVTSPQSQVVNDIVVIDSMKRVMSDPNMSPKNSESEARNGASRSASSGVHFSKDSASHNDDVDDDGYADAVSTPVRVRTTSSFSQKEEEVKAMLLQLSQAGIGVDDLIRMKGVLQAGDAGGEAAEKSAADMDSKKADENPQPPQNPAEAMKAMFAKRAGSVNDSNAPPPAPASTPNNPAEAMKAMFAARHGSVISAASVGFVDDAPAKGEEEEKPKNPADAMKAMFAKRRQTAPAIPTMSDVADETDDGENSESRPKSTPQSTQSAEGSGEEVPLKQDPRFIKYFKMLKMGIPMPAVKQGMVKDSVDPAVMDMDHNKPYVAPPMLKMDERFVKYYKMLKMMIPRDAVKNGMIKDGFNPDILDEAADAPLPPGFQVEYKRPVPPAPKVGKPMNEDPDFAKYKKYFTMVKMGLPSGAAKNAMIKDGLAESETYIMDLDPKKSHASQAPAVAGGAAAAKEVAPAKPKSRRKKLDWKPIQQTNIDKNSIWGELAADDEVLDLDMHEFDSLFVSRASPETKKKKSAPSDTPPKKKAAVQVISGKRGMNGGIVLARLKVPYSDIAGAIDNLKEGVLTPEQLQNLRECLPDRDETRSLQDYMKKHNNSYDELCECEKFMCTMLEVNNASDKIASLILKSNFANRRTDVIETAKFIETACDDVRMSFRLKKMLAIILKVGNQLNHGTDDSNGNSKDGDAKVHAKAFTLESLLKLNQAKAFDKKTSILHYLVMLVKRNDESLLRFKDDIQSVNKAEKIQFSYVNEELTKLNKELGVVKAVAIAEGTKMKEASEKDGSALARKMSLVDLSSQKTKLKTADGTTHYDTAVPMDAEGLGLTPIGRFAMDATEAWNETKEYTTKVWSKFCDVLKYFGEDDKLTPGQFFTTLSAFIRAFDNALDDVTKEEKKKAREERLAQMKKDQEERKAKGVGVPKLSRNSSGGSKDGSVSSTASPDGDSPKKTHKKITAGRRASTMGSFRPSEGSSGGGKGSINM